MFKGIMMSVQHYSIHHPMVITRMSPQHVKVLKLHITIVAINDRCTITQNMVCLHNCILPIMQGINLVLNSSVTINIQQIIKLINFDIYCFFIFILKFCTDLCGWWILNTNAPILSINSRPSNGLICPMKTNPSKQASPLPCALCVHVHQHYLLP